MKKETRKNIISVCGVLIAIGVALVIATFVGNKDDINHLNYGDTVPAHSTAKPPAS